MGSLRFNVSVTLFCFICCSNHCNVLQVVRLLYTNSGLAVLALASNALHKLWKWQRNERNPSGKVRIWFIIFFATWFLTQSNLNYMMCIFSLLPLACLSCGSQLMGLLCPMMWVMPKQLKTLLHVLPCLRMIPMSCLRQGEKSPCSIWWPLRCGNIFTWVFPNFIILGLSTMCSYDCTLYILENWFAY